MSGRPIVTWKRVRRWAIPVRTGSGNIEGRPDDGREPADESGVASRREVKEFASPRDMLLDNALALPAEAVAEIRFEGRTVACLTGAFIAGIVAADPDAEFSIPTRHPSRTGFGLVGTGQLVCEWKTAQGETLLASTCPADRQPAVPQSPPEAFGPHPAQLISFEAGSDRAKAAFHRPQRATRVLAYLDAVLVAWIELPAAGAEASGGEPFFAEFSFPGFLESAVSRFTFFTDRGLQLVHGPRLSDGQGLHGTGRAAKFGILANGALSAVVVERPPAHRRDLLALYAIHTKVRTLSAVHKKVIGELKRRGAVVCVINSYHGHTAEILADAKGVDLFISRSDFGRDFASWCAVFELYSEWIGSFERTLFINDSIVGPLIDMSPAFDFFENTPGGLSALSDSHSVRYHLQSSIFQVRKAAWEVEKFKSFFTDYGYPDERALVVAQGEIGLSRAALDAGIDTDVMCRYDAVIARWLDALPMVAEQMLALPEVRVGRLVRADGRDAPYTFERRFVEWAQHMASDIRQGTARNVQHTFWDTLVRDFRYPFIKREVLTANPEELPSLFLLKDLVAPEYRDFVRSALQEASENSLRVFGVFYAPP